jgi:hypothetical protein
VNFKQWLETIYYHGTTPENAASILQTGIDPSKYKSGMFQGFYLTPSLSYFDGQKKSILAIEVDDSQLLDADQVKDEELMSIDPHFKMMSPMYRNSLIKKLALKTGFSGVRNGKEVILFNNEAVKSIKLLHENYYGIVPNHDQKPTKVFINPTDEELAKIGKSIQGWPRIRAILTPTDVYAWNPFEAFHGSIAKKIEKGISIMVVFNNDQAEIWLPDSFMGKTGTIKNHPYLRKKWPRITFRGRGQEDFTSSRQPI